MTLKKVFISLSSAFPGAIQAFLKQQADSGLIFSISSLYTFKPQTMTGELLVHEAMVISWESNQLPASCLTTWSSPEISISILLHGNDIHLDPQVPHPALKKRDHFLYPLLEIAPGLVHPDGSSIMSACSSFGDSSLQKKMSRYDLSDYFEFIE
ncbi:MAG: hypothetical protein ACON5A_00320 [Candidatus Comchoanobacterales bacterium]